MKETMPRPADSAGERIETDALGSRRIDDAHYYGIQTVRAQENFSVSGKTIADIPGFIESVIRIKQAAGLANLAAGGLPGEIAEAIVAAGDHCLHNFEPSQFSVDIYHGGGGTAANMNVNEVLANRANEALTGRKGYDRVHPNTHVNMGQSTNDVIPSAMKLAVHGLLAQLEGTVSILVEALAAKETEFAGVIKLSRTCFQDALPITFGQQLSGYRHGFQRALREMEAMKRKCLNLPLGATAVGTEFGALAGYKAAIYAELSRITGLALEPDENFFDGLQNADQWISISGALKSLALSMAKMCADLRLMSSGPRAGLSEITLPAVQPGSSIMPGKINPVIPEMAIQVYFRVLGNDATVTRACEGELDLNVWESIILNVVTESIILLDRTIPLLVSKCIAGLTANEAICRKAAEGSLALSTAIAAVFDYPNAGSVAHFAAERGLPVKDAAVEMSLLSRQEAEELFEVSLFADPLRYQTVIQKYRLLAQQGALGGSSDGTTGST
ncbi:aspartate ammonia-lyase [Mesorhizobium sp. VK24D]|uniref:Aspartate ammonia-lyase n=1 Tax=Mesorhizobium album TaxID=3072314 RepID=A0ABU4Y122_9HYPH|nr:aspartate ammonia-lyase [Mesorhizobium sp. VK24D]MDX8480646.1 aspartate ammonia-lyase [Mesorhizobium sp. VK24D]